ncbi:MAG: 50S ribosomal protein L11 [bacterium]
MAKKIKALVKLQIPAGAANPAPPVGPALGQHGVNIQDFCQKFNAATQAMRGDTVPVIITIYDDRSFTFIMKTPPAADLIKKAIGLAKGSGKPQSEKVGKITMAQIRAIAEKKMPDMNCRTVDAAARCIAGTAKNMGVEIVG